MATKRLTNALRESLRDDILRHRFQKETDDLLDRRAKFAEKVYNDIFPKKTREKMKALPEGWLPTRSSIKATFGTDYVILYFNGTTSSFSQKLRYGSDRDYVYRPVLASKDSNVAKAYEANSELADEYTDVYRETEDLVEKISRASSGVMAVLNSVTTLGALVKGWPEIEQFTRKYVITNPSTALALPTQELNVMLGLPPEENIKCE